MIRTPIGESLPRAYMSLLKPRRALGLISDRTHLSALVFRGILVIAYRILDH